MATKAASIKAVEEPTTASLYFRDKGKVQPDGYDGLGINDEVTVILKGSVRSLGVSSWEKGKRIEVELASCEIVKPATPAGIEGAIQAAEKSRKKV